MNEINLVCDKCVTDKYLKEYIKKNGKNNSEVKCDCCGEVHSGKNEYIIEYEKIAKYVTECIERVYQPAKVSTQTVSVPFKDKNTPTQFIPFTSDKIWGSIEDEQRIFGENTTYTVMSDFGDMVSTMDILHSLTNNHDLVEQLFLYIGVVNYERKDFIHKDKHYKNKWDLFTEYVKYKKEHVFDFTDPFNSDNYLFEYGDPMSMLDDIYKIIKDNQKGCECLTEDKMLVYRARGFKDEPKFIINEEELTSPPKYKAKVSNRMSFKGDSYFYCSDNAETAEKEVENKDKFYYYIGKWSVVKPQKIIDFEQFIDVCKRKKADSSHKITVPGLFASNNAEYYDYEFIESFENNISKPNNGNNDDYLPTQIVTSYLRSRMKELNGVSYRSVHKTGKNFCFFYNHTEARHNGVLQFVEDGVGESVHKENNKSGENITVNVTVN